MQYNLNAGFGRMLADKIAMGVQGKTFVVGKSALAYRDQYSQIFGTDPDGKARFFSTIDAAVGACTANSGDTIYVLPGHTETLSNATSLLLDVAGIKIIGLGYGSNIPTITMDTATTTTIPVSAANITVENIIVTANFADIVAPFTLTTANNFTLNKVYIKATATDMNFLYVVDTNATTADANGLKITNCKWIEPDTATLSMVKMDGTNADIVIDNNFVQVGVNNNKATLVAIATGKIITNAQITNNRVFRLNTDTATGGLLVTTDGSTNSGVIANNFAQHADTAAEILVTASSGFGFFNNYASGVAGASGYLLPAADS